MKYVQVIFWCLFPSLAFCSAKTFYVDNITIPMTQNFTAVSREIKPEVVLSEDAEVLEKWRSIEKTSKMAASEAVKTILPWIVRSSEGISISSQCTSSLMKMIIGIKQMKLWAYQMLDSSGKIPNGILNGFLSSFGDFDGCLLVDVPGSNAFRGEYCSVFITPPLPKRMPFHDVDIALPLFANFSKKGMLVEEMSSQAHYFHHVALRTSVCMPSTCSRQDVQIIAEMVMSWTNLSLHVSVPTCDVEEPLIFSTSHIIIISVLCLIGLLAFTATAADVYFNIFDKESRQKLMASSTALKCLMCFSTYTNTLLILKEDSSPHSIKVFHGMKVITMLWVMLNHTYFYTNFNMCGSLRNMREFGKEIAFQVISNAYFSVETFFFISAVLLAYGRMKFTGKYINIPTYIFRRVWRLTPPHMLVIATAMLVRHMGSGPGWKETVVSLIDQCSTSWWKNLIFINNFFGYKDTCFQWLWYIAADTHLYILALFIMAPIKSRPRLALGINVSLFVAGIIMTAAFHARYDQLPTVIYAFLHPDDWNYYIDYSHLRTYTHMMTCCIGLYVGCFLAEKPKLKIPKVLNIFGWFFSFILGLLPLYGVYKWTQGDIPGTAISALYACTGKVAWSLALSYVTVACFTGNGGVFASILSWSAFVPLSRLTYVAYLIHPIFQFMYIGSTRTPLPLDHRTNVYRFISNVVVSYCFAYMISLLFECPFMGLEKVMFSKRASSKVTVTPKPKENGMPEGETRCVESSVSVIDINKIQNVKH